MTAAASAEPNTELSPSTPAATRKAASAGLAAKILKQGKPAAHVASAAPLLAQPGKYRVTHGSVTLGYDEQGERVVAHPGAVVDLTASEAGPLVHSETVTFIG